MTAKKPTTPVNITLKMKITRPARRRFLPFGCSISRYTCASDSSPLMARIECPKPTKIATAVNVGQIVPFSQPSACSLKSRFSRVGSGGSVPPCCSKVSRHHRIRITTITVVIFRMFSASLLDSWRPRVFCHQKYTVIRMATTTAVRPSDRWNVDPLRVSSSLARPATYRPADTPLIGPVST